MSNTVDNRVVQLGFDNGQFENGVKTSVNSLESLKKSLNLDASVKSLTNLGDVGRNFNLENMSKAVQGVSDRFSTLGIVGITILQNLTNTAINYGKKLLSEFTAPIKKGLGEYETQINAVQTILANTAAKGTDIRQVNEALDQLNTYADKTIYNFTEMARNIGTFTAAGVDLDVSVQAIKGIANLAAVSGSNSQQAATAMYQLSQALSSGTVKLMDWNSVVNAGMGGQVFQDALKETARVHGVAIDAMIEDTGSFRETLQEGWLTSEILTETLSKFTGDLTAEQLKTMGYTEEQIAGILKLGETANDAATKVKTFTQLTETIQEALVSGWAQSWRIILGDFEEAKLFFTEISDTLGPIIQASSDARNKILQDWKDAGGRKYLIDALRNSFQGLMGILKPITEAFKEIFPPTTGVRLATISRLLKELTDRFKVSGETAEKIKTIFKGVFSIFDILRMGIVALVKGFIELIAPIKKPSAGSILDFLSNIAEYIIKIRDMIKYNDLFTAAFRKVGETIWNVSQIVINFLKEFSKRLDPLKSTISNIFKNVDTSGIDKFFEKFSLRIEPLKALSKIVGVILGGLFKLAQKGAPLLFKLGSIVANFLLNLGSAISDAVTNLDFTKLFDLINSGLIAALILATKKFMDSGSGFIGEASGIFGGITNLLDGVRGSLEAWQQSLKAKTLLMIASAIGILTISLIALSMIDSDKLTIALGAVTAMFLELMGAMAIYSKVSGIGGGVGASLGLIALSTSILIMSAAVSKLAKLKPEEVEQGLGSIGALTIGLAVLSKIMSQNIGDILKGSVGFIAFSISLLILVEVVKKLGSLNPAALTNGLLGVGVMLGEIAAFMKLVNLDKMGVSKGLGLLILAGSIMVMATAVEKFANMNTAKMQQGLIALGLVLGQLSLFTRLTGSGVGIISTAVGMTILAGSMLIFAEAVTKMGNLSWEELGKGMAGMAGSLLIMAGAIKLLPKNMIVTAFGLVIMASSLVILSQALTTMGNMSWEEIARGLTVLAGSMLIMTLALYAMQGTLSGSFALIVAAGALTLLTPVLQTLGSMSLGEIGLALLTLAGVFVVLGIAGYALTPVVPTLLGLGASMLLIGIAAALVGVGLLAFSAGLAAIAVSGGVAAVAIVGMISTILGIIPMVIQSLINAIIIFGKGIIQATPVVRDAIKGLLLAVLDIIIDVTPKLIEALGVLLDGLIQLIYEEVPTFIEAALYLLGELLKNIAAKVPDFVQSGMDILLGFLKGIRDNIFEIVTVAIEIVTNFLDAVAEKIPDIVESGVNVIIEFINGLARAVEEQGPRLNAAIGNLAKAIIKGLTDGITSGVGGVVAAIGRLAGAAIDALKTLLGIFSPSKVFAKLGEAVPLGFVKGVLRFGVRVAESVKVLGKKAINGMKDAIDQIRESLTNDIDMDPTIRPVVDLSDIVSGGKEIDKLLGRKSFSIAGSMEKVSDISSNQRDFNFGDKPSIEGSKISLVQNNYSPKALSRLEIYRQTKNQLLTLKGLV